MKTSWSHIAIVFFAFISISSGNAPPGTEEVGPGYCRNWYTDLYDFGISQNVHSVDECDQLCRRNDPGQGLRGFHWGGGGGTFCTCHYEDGLNPEEVTGSCPPDFDRMFLPCYTGWRGRGPIDRTDDSGTGDTCYRYTTFPVGSPPSNGEYMFQSGCLIRCVDSI